ncbi:MAG: MucB/RseB C-terminal domain-containing protein [Gammaproteobacteria bacterium]|nr:MucB/RseB C-terminal domain-containing protein [Gammaproteobacteria bacterium]
MRTPGGKTLVWLVIAAGQLACGSAALAERIGPSEWLSRMGTAVQMTSYEGTVIRIQDGKAEALKVIHTVSDGVIREKVVAQEGNGLEIIRNGNEVHCILPDRRSVLIEEWDDQSTLFSTLPSSEVRFGSEYDVSIVREERVAGRQAILVAIRPHDDYRYGHRIWLDTETAFPLQTQLIDEGEPIEQVKFADISLNKEIHASDLEPSYSTENFRWLKQPSRHVSHKLETTWASTEMPPGFRPISTHGETMPGSETVVTHILYSDGLASVSVFVAPQGAEITEGPSRVGGSNSYSAIRDGHRITAVGEVPAVTVEQIATTMMRR